MTAAAKGIRAALRAHLVPRVRALGFTGGLAGLRRAQGGGVDVLVIPLFKGVVQLDAGHVRRRGAVAARTVREDWAVYASTRRDKRATRRRLEDARGKGVFRYDTIKGARALRQLAESLAIIVETDGVRFWGAPVPRPSVAENARRVATQKRARAATPTFAAAITAALVTAGFAGTMKGTSGAFRREDDAVVALVSLSVGEGEVLVQAATRKPGRRTGARSPALDFLHAPDREDLLTRSLARGSTEAHVRAIVRAVKKRFARA